MRNLFKTALVAILLTLPGLSLAQQWEEGEHYEVISEQASPSKNVREIFSFWCPHCFTFEPIAAQLKEKLPKDVEFVKAHVNFMGTASQQAQNDATAAMLSAKAMGEEQRFNTALFSAIHKDRATILGMSDIADIFARAGGDREKLIKMSKSFGIKGQVSKNDKLIRGTNRVPAFIINGKYKANFTRDMTADQFVDLLIWLTKQD